MGKRGALPESGEEPPKRVKVPETPTDILEPETSKYVDSDEETLHETYAVGPNCVHECLRPKDSQLTDPKPYPAKEQMAKTYPYELDTFQRRAVLAIENDESVLVAAHTSAGKTTVAEYAIAMALSDNQRVIYTSPIKALSNQKYQDLRALFNNEVGLLTGDSSLFPDAPVMVMTTEILRSMLFRGSQLVKEVKWIIFDEVHYMNDRERGVVWEETMILLSNQCRFVFLSATIPNANEFAEWISQIKAQPCHTIYTDYRPVPLQHFVHAAGSELYLVVDAQKKFHERNFSRAIEHMDQSLLQMATSNKKVGGGGPSGRMGESLQELITFAHRSSLTPMIIFFFSKAKVEDAAKVAMASLDLTTEYEKRQIKAIFEESMTILSKEDRELPCIYSVLALLERGIGIHHGGLLPVIKEITEILFGSGLLKVLFTTETFAMGVNMPARTVVFGEIRKFDGERERIVNGGEYIQMSGRAGRRNTDKNGMVIVMLTGAIEPDDAKEVFLGSANRLESTFRLTYNMILNLFRLARDTKPDYMILRSFRQMQTRKRARTVAGKRKALEKELEASASFTDAIVAAANLRRIKIVQLPGKMKGHRSPVFHKASEVVPPPPHWETDIEDMADSCNDYFQLEVKQRRALAAIRLMTLKPAVVDSYITPGRIVQVATPLHEQVALVASGETIKNYGAGLIIERKNIAEGSGQDRIILKLLVQVNEDPKMEEGATLYMQDLQPGTEAWVVASADYRWVDKIGKHVAKIKGEPWHLKATRERFGKSIRQLDPSFFNLRDWAVIRENLVAKADAGMLDDALEAANKDLRSHVWNGHPLLTSGLEHINQQRVLRHRLSKLSSELKDLNSMILAKELESRVSMLKDLGFVSDDGALTTKGRVSCEITSTNELILTELLFQGHLKGLSPELVAAWLACLTYDDSRRQKEAKEPEFQHAPLEIAYRTISDIAHRVYDAGVTAGVEAHLNPHPKDTLDPTLMDFAYEWMLGEKSFGKLIREYESLKLYEGSVVRVMRRLEECLRQMANASNTLSNQEAVSTFESAKEKIRRGVIFNASLYL